MYITSTIKTKSSRLAKPVLCLGTLCAAFLTGLNRVSEYRNHCSDVIAGFILGSAVALFLVGELLIHTEHLALLPHFNGFCSPRNMAILKNLKGFVVFSKLRGSKRVCCFIYSSIRWLLHINQPLVMASD